VWPADFICAPFTSMPRKEPFWPLRCRDDGHLGRSRRALIERIRLCLGMVERLSFRARQLHCARFLGGEAVRRKGSHAE
jgi:hypothetical protein